jgi:hypothetical protein
MPDLFATLTRGHCRADTEAIMQKQSDIENRSDIGERILGLIMGLGIGTIIGFLLRTSERRDDHFPATRTAPSVSGAPQR